MMTFKDLGLWALIVVAIMASDVALTLVGWHTPRAGDYDRACLLAAFVVLIHAVRDRKGSA